MANPIFTKRYAKSQFVPLTKNLVIFELTYQLINIHKVLCVTILGQKQITLIAIIKNPLSFFLSKYHITQKQSCFLKYHLPETGL